jgi:hypothetical protein
VTGRSPAQRYAALIEAFLDDPDVTHPSRGDDAKGFGSDALKVHGRIFAMLTRDQLVVKLPRRRVDELIDAGRGTRFDPGHGRLMKEWLEVGPATDDEWLELAREAREFVGFHTRSSKE